MTVLRSVTALVAGPAGVLLALSAGTRISLVAFGFALIVLAVHAASPWLEPRSVRRRRIRVRVHYIGAGHPNALSRLDRLDRHHHRTTSTAP